MLGSLRNASEADLMHEIAHPLPVRAIARMLGIPATMQPQLIAWSDVLATFLGSPRRPLELVTAAQEAVLALTNFFREVVAQRRLAKGNDLISLLLDIEEDGEVLTEEELYAQCVMLLFGGHETTRNLIGNGLLTLLRHPDQAARLRDDASLIRSAVEELLRYESPVQNISRITKEEVEICGQRMSAGSVIYCILGSANRDPQHFKNANSLELERLNNSHLAFGAGAHFCIGNQISRLEAQTAILALLRTFPDMRLATDQPHWSKNFTLRGLEKLEVSLAHAKSV
jgi:cytochrome P450